MSVGHSFEAPEGATMKFAKHISSVGSRKGLQRAGASKLASVRAWVRNSKAKVVSVVYQPR
jgi:hypothetical protein